MCRRWTQLLQQQLKNTTINLFADADHWGSGITATDEENEEEKGGKHHHVYLVCNVSTTFYERNTHLGPNHHIDVDHIAHLFPN
jgi:hypothetical protein